jgi:flagellar biosynthesis protein FliR
MPAHPRAPLAVDEWSAAVGADVGAALAGLPGVVAVMAEPLVAGGWTCRLVAAVWVGALPLGRQAPAGLRLALAVALALVGLPAALTTRPDVTAVSPPLLIGMELVVGVGLGLVAATIVAAAAWAGAIVGSVAGLSWSGDFAVEGEEDAAGTARLAWWCGVAAFFAAGGHLAVVGGLLDSAAALPVGSTVTGDATGHLLAVATAVPGLALSLTFAIAAPLLAALVAFHLAAAICLRTVGLAPGSGLLQALSALVLLAALVVGGDVWLTGFGTAARTLVTRGLAAVGDR